jgi:Family of unknown function (DUF6527)
MAKRNTTCVIVEDLPFEAPAGHAMFVRDGAGKIVGFIFGCPCGCGSHYGGSTVLSKSGWTWDGNEQKPTMSPSWGCCPNHESPVGPDGTYHWHGFLKAGVFEEC